MPTIDDLRKSNFITKADVGKGILVTIIGCKEYNVAKDGAEPDLRWALIFDEIDKPFICNVTNGEIIKLITRTGNIDDWKGTRIVLYHEPNIMYGGKMVGGIRVRAPRKDYQEPEPPPPQEDDDIPF